MTMMQIDNSISSPITSALPSASPFALTANAIKRIAYLLSDEPSGSVLRVSVMGGGCSGFQYKFEFETTPPQEDDRIIADQGARVVVDSVSEEFLKDAMLDYVETLGGAAFEIKNPNTTSSCGCGNSFSVV